MGSGTRVGPYEVLALLGQGGMGEVYRARDTTLGRDVAIKILPRAFVTDPERLARFEREARTLASLNHPHIGAIYGLEATDDAPALVLELVDGDTLAERVAKGPLPVALALTLASQIADALEAAHERGIVHRDLKPANIKITAGGVVKVLDFGLAKAATGGEEARDPAQIQTVTIAGTRDGLILGTAAYMSPEQARGLAVDKRADIWAFACVMFEMLTARRVFGGATMSDTIVSILEREPAWSTLPAATPPMIVRVLRRCLEKDPRRRLRDIADVRLEIDDAIKAPSRVEVTSGSARHWSATQAAIALGTVVVAVSAVFWSIRPAPSATASARGPVARLLVAPADPLAEPTSSCVANECGSGAIAISPDGRRLAYAASRAGRQQLYVREIDQFESKPVSGTDGGYGPVFSPDGLSLAFVADGKLKQVAVSGGVPLTLGQFSEASSLSWGTDNTILFNSGAATGIWRVSANGGAATPLTTIGKDLHHRFPEMLPGGKALLYSSVNGIADDQIFVQSIETGQRRALVKGVGPHYLSTGHLVFVQAGALMAVPFDPVRLETTGTPVVVLDGVAQTASRAPQISFSLAGSMVYVPATTGTAENTLVWVDRTGQEHSTGASGRQHAQPRLTPDGRQVAVTLGGSTTDVWAYDLTRETWSRLTFEGASSFPLWTPDGRRLTFSSGKAGPYDIYWKPIDGSAPEERLLSGDRSNLPLAWSPDGSVLAFVSPDPKTSQDIWLVTPGEKGKPRPFLQTRFREGAPVFSPDGRWLAYVSDESGRSEIYVRPFPGPGEERTISTDGGNEPVWPRGARQLFYRNGDSMMVVDIDTTPTLTTGKPRRLFNKPYVRSNAFWPNYDVTSDGQRLLMIKASPQTTSPPQINVVLNWLDELKQRVPTK